MGVLRSGGQPQQILACLLCGLRVGCCTAGWALGGSQLACLAYPHTPPCPLCSEKDAAALIREIVSVVAHCHSLGVMHR